MIMMVVKMMTKKKKQSNNDNINDNDVSTDYATGPAAANYNNDGDTHKWQHWRMKIAISVIIMVVTFKQSKKSQKRRVNREHSSIRLDQRCKT